MVLETGEIARVFSRQATNVNSNRLQLRSVLWTSDIYQGPECYSPYKSFEVKKASEVSAVQLYRRFWDKLMAA